MIKKEERNSIIEICPVRNVVSRFGNKWALLVILVLSEQGTVRFNELCRLIPDVSSRVLSGTLRTLEADGLIARKVYPVVPPKVEYRLTDIGSSLVPFIVQLTEWAQTNMKSIIKHRKDLVKINKRDFWNKKEKKSHTNTSFVFYNLTNNLYGTISK